MYTTIDNHENKHIGRMHQILFRLPLQQNFITDVSQIMSPETCITQMTFPVRPVPSSNLMSHCRNYYKHTSISRKACFLGEWGGGGGYSKLRRLLPTQILAGGDSSDNGISKRTLKLIVPHKGDVIKTNTT